MVYLKRVLSLNNQVSLLPIPISKIFGLGSLLTDNPNPVNHKVGLMIIQYNLYSDMPHKVCETPMAGTPPWYS